MILSSSLKKQNEDSKRTSYFREYRRKTRGSKSTHPTGSIGENVALSFFNGSILVRKPTHDIEWFDKKIEVKTALPRPENPLAWNYVIKENQLNHADYFIFICLTNEYKVYKFYFIPRSEIKKRYIWLGKHFENEYAPYVFNNLEGSTAQ